MSKNQFNNQDIAYSSQWIINCAKQCLSHAFFYRYKLLSFISFKLIIF